MMLKEILLAITMKLWILHTEVQSKFCSDPPFICKKIVTEKAGTVYKKEKIKDHELMLITVPRNMQQF